jgi:hypothetical protein
MSAIFSVAVIVPKAYAAPPADALVFIDSGLREHLMTPSPGVGNLIPGQGGPRPSRSPVPNLPTPIPNVPGLFGR